MSLGYMLGAGMDGYMQGKKFKEEREDRKEDRARKKKVDEGTQAVMDFLAAALGPPPDGTGSAPAPNQTPVHQTPPQAQQGLQAYLAGNR